MPNLDTVGHFKGSFLNLTKVFSMNIRKATPSSGVPRTFIAFRSDPEEKVNTQEVIPCTWIVHSEKSQWHCLPSKGHWIPQETVAVFF